MEQGEGVWLCAQANVTLRPIPAAAKRPRGPELTSALLRNSDRDAGPLELDALFSGRDSDRDPKASPLRRDIVFSHTPASPAVTGSC